MREEMEGDRPSATSFWSERRRKQNLDATVEVEGYLQF